MSGSKFAWLNLYRGRCPAPVGIIPPGTSSDYVFAWLSILLALTIRKCIGKHTPLDISSAMLTAQSYGRSVAVQLKELCIWSHQLRETNCGLYHARMHPGQYHTHAFKKTQSNEVACMPKLQAQNDFTQIMPRHRWPRLPCSR